MGDENFFTVKGMKFYTLDFDKIKTTEDVIRILKALDIKFAEGVKNIESIKDLIKEE